MLAASLAAGSHVVLEGPPGTGKSTLLRAVADGAGLGVEFVEGNAELTPARLVGHFDPALVLEAGYKPEIFVDGAADHGAARRPAAVHRGAQPRPRGDAQRARRRAGRGRDPRAAARPHPAAPGFRLIAAMNPFDAVGTARVSQAIADRMCRIAIGYQDARRRARDRRARHRRAERRWCVRRRAHPAHPRAPAGADGLVGARGDRPRPARPRPRAPARRGRAGAGRRHFADAAVAALSGRLRLEEGCEHTPEEIVLELIERLLPAPKPKEPEPPGKAGPAPGGRAAR